MNRLFRRMERFTRNFPSRRSQGEMVDRQRGLYDPSRPQDTADTRAKSSGHGKKTADKWNQ
jgi:hypothetical protein